MTRCTLAIACACVIIATAQTGCAGRSGQPSPETETRKAGQSLPPHATLTVEATDNGGQPGLRAELLLPAALLPDAPVDVLFPSSWAGRTGFLRDIHDVRAENAHSNPARMVAVGPGRLLVHHDAATHIVVSWRLSPETDSYNETTRFRALNHEGRIFAPAHALLAQPINLGEHLPVQLTLPNGEVTFAGSSQRHSTFAELVNGAFLAGPWEISEQICGGERLRIASTQPIPQNRERRICDTIRAQRGLHRHSSTLAVIVPRNDPRTPMTGSSFDGGFVLELPDGQIPDSNELLELVAHEGMHRLIGHRISFDRTREAEILWFLEGTTEYLAFRTLAAAGLIGADRLMERFEEAMDATASIANPQYRYGGLWDDEELRRSHYDRGLLVSLALDLDLISSSESLRPFGTGLRGFVSWLGHLPAPDRTGLDLQRLQALLLQYAGDELGPAWLGPRLGSEIPTNLDALLAEHAGIRVHTRSETVPDFGLRAAMTASGTWYLVEVEPDSPASRAGLHAGLVLASPPRHPSEARNSARAHLEIVLPTSNGQRTIQLSPSSRTVIRHSLDIVDTQRFQSYLNAGAGSTPPRSSTAEAP